VPSSVSQKLESGKTFLWLFFFYLVTRINFFGCPSFRTAPASHFEFDLIFFFSKANIFVTHSYATMTWRSNKALTHVGLDKVKKDQKWNFIFFKKFRLHASERLPDNNEKSFFGFRFFLFQLFSFYFQNEIVVLPVGAPLLKFSARHSK